jgi:hypothetical protein
MATTQSFPGAEAIVAAYEDQVEALERLLRARASLSADPHSRLHGQSDAEIQLRLEANREELDRWALMMVVASFEATLRTDAAARIRSKTRDEARKPLRDLHAEHEGRVRLDDLLAIWERHTPISAAVRNSVRRLLKHRHWLAHGRHWTPKHGVMPSPLEARADLDDYVQALQMSVHDFPRA